MISGEILSSVFARVGAIIIFAAEEGFFFSSDMMSSAQ